MTRWGIVATIKAPDRAILDFAAWHLEQGAHRLYLYFDDDAPDILPLLQDHPRIRPRVTDVGYWAGKRPHKHQVRQCANAHHAAHRKPDCAWLAHIDVDEFLIPASPIADQLGALPADTLCARVAPMEALAPGAGAAPGETVFKTLAPDKAQRIRDAEACFPEWGPFLPGGFLSHMQGKLFFRTGLAGLDIRIHNMRVNGVENPGESPLTDTALGHFHAADWAHFLALYRFRMKRGSYRAELKPPRRDDPDAPNLHSLFRTIEDAGGEDALRGFFTEICTATPALCDRLQARGRLARHRLPLEDLRSRHFPDASA